jgi:hypothetical protein
VERRSRSTTPAGGQRVNLTSPTFISKPSLPSSAPPASVKGVKPFEVVNKTPTVIREELGDFMTTPQEHALESSDDEEEEKEEPEKKKKRTRGARSSRGKSGSDESSGEDGSSSSEENSDWDPRTEGKTASQIKREKAAKEKEKEDAEVDRNIKMHEKRQLKELKRDPKSLTGLQRLKLESLQAKRKLLDQMNALPPEVMLKAKPGSFITHLLKTTCQIILECIRKMFFVP